MQASRCSVKLIELPVVMTPVYSSFFVLPNFSDVFPLLPTDIDHVLQRRVSSFKLCICIDIFAVVFL